jgi:hypothetical protein
MKLAGLGPHGGSGFEAEEFRDAGFEDAAVHVESGDWLVGAGFGRVQRG